MTPVETTMLGLLCGALGLNELRIGVDDDKQLILRVFSFLVLALGGIISAATLYPSKDSDLLLGYTLLVAAVTSAFNYNFYIYRGSSRAVAVYGCITVAASIMCLRAFIA